MRINHAQLSLLLTATLLAPSSAFAQAQAEDTGTAHKAAATALLNSNNTGAAHLACPATIGPVSTANSPAGPGRAGGPPGGPGAAKGGGRGPAAVPAKETWYAEGGQVFDNLYMLTTKMNSAWAVKTSAGIILIDTLFGYAAQDAIVDGLKKVGLNAADIKYIIVSHAHGDHDGAVKFLQDTYNPHVIMGPKDWELAAREAAPPRHDMEAVDGQKLTLGDTTVTIYITPGHTGGTLSVMVPVKDHGQPHMAMEWGGTALSGGTSKEMLESYISNAKRFKDISGGMSADVIIGNHTEYNDALNRLERTKARKAGEPNPWVVGKGEVEKYLTVVEECAKSWLAIGNGRP
ncbi:MAG: MBL fold metallo-hydrolase [Acidobacteriota bacterium]